MTLKEIFEQKRAEQLAEGSAFVLRPADIQDILTKMFGDPVTVKNRFKSASNHFWAWIPEKPSAAVMAKMKKALEDGLYPNRKMSSASPIVHKAHLDNPDGSKSGVDMRGNPAKKGLADVYLGKGYCVELSFSPLSAEEKKARKQKIAEAADLKGKWAWSASYEVKNRSGDDGPASEDRHEDGIIDAASKEEALAKLKKAHPRHYDWRVHQATPHDTEYYGD